MGCLVDIHDLTKCLGGGGGGGGANLIMNGQHHTGQNKTCIIRI